MATATNALTTVRFKNILFATDFSEYSRQALPYATELARRFDSTLRLCHVVTPSQLMVAAPETAPFLYEAERNQGADDLRNMARLPEFGGLKVKTVLLSGMLEDELMRAIDENQIDLIVLGTHGRTGVSRLLLGSVAEETCRIAKCPVLTVGPDIVLPYKAQFRRILVPTNFSDESTAVLPYVREIARKYEATITFFHVIPLDAGTNVNGRVLAADAGRTLKRVFADECEMPTPEVLVEFGHPLETILRTAQETRADLIAMGIRHGVAPGLQLRSSLAYQITAGAHCPVLTCR